MIDKEELGRLKELAEIADKEEYVAWLPDKGYENQARFINAANPATILTMIAEIERLEKLIDMGEFAFYRRLEEGLKRFLGHIDMAQGTPISRFNSPDYSPMPEDIDEAMKRVDGLIEAYARLAEAYSDLEKEADWLANKLVAAAKMLANATGMETGDLNEAGWRKAAREAVEGK